MEVKIVKEEKNKMIIELPKEGHTFLNALKEELWNDKHVKVSGYRIDHPLVGIPRLIVETDGKETPKKALIAAAERLKKQGKKFKELIGKLRI